MSEIIRKHALVGTTSPSRVTAAGNHDPIRDGHTNPSGPVDHFPAALQARLKSAYRLTAAECRVVGGLLDGLSPREIGAHAGTSVNTVNTQLKSVFAKTGAHRQQDVIRLCFELQRGMPGSS